MADGDWHTARTTVAGITFDRAGGLGSVPNGEDIDHLGATVLMRPSAFLALAHELRERRPASLSALGQAIAGGRPLSPPFLSLAWPGRPGSLPSVVSHEGRHRMLAIHAAAGNVPVPVHLFVFGRKASFLDGERIDRMRSGAFGQDRVHAVHGPLFSDAHVAGRTFRGPATPDRNATAPHRPFEPSANAESFLSEALRRHGPGLTLRGALDELSGLDDDGLDLYLGLDLGEGPEHHVLMREVGALVGSHGAGTPLDGLVEAPPGPRP